MFREIITDLMPPILYRPTHALYRRLRYGARSVASETPAMFEGHYKSLEDVPCGPARYDDDEFAALNATYHLEQLRRAGEFKAQADYTGRCPILPLVTSQFGEGPLSVLDLGGSACLGLTEILEYAPRLDLSTFHYINIETAAMCRALRRPIETILRSRFSTTSFAAMTDAIPDVMPAPLIVNCASSLEYVSDYAATLDRLAHLAPEFFIVSFTPMSDEPTYACQQLLRGRRLAQWVFNRADIIARMARRGYCRVFAIEHPDALTFERVPKPFRMNSIVFRRYGAPSG